MPLRLAPARFVTPQGQSSAGVVPVPARFRVRTDATTTAIAHGAGELGLRHKVLISLMVVGALVAVAGSGTFATFNGTAVNPPSVNTVSLILGDTTTATECLSTISSGGATTTIAANKNTGCTAQGGGPFFSVSGASILPGNSSSTFNTKIKTHLPGGVLATGLKVHADAACSNSAVGGALYSGGGNLCAGVSLVVARTDATFTTLQQCVYGGAGAGASPFTGCVFDATHTLADFGTNHQLAGELDSGLSAIANATTAYFVVGVSFLKTSDTTTQGMKTNQVFDWRLEQ